jgi:hypothetical protein
MRWGNVKFKLRFVEFIHVAKYTVPKDSENFVTSNNGAGPLLSVMKVFVIDSWRPAVVVISNEILICFLCSISKPLQDQR